MEKYYFETDVSNSNIYTLEIVIKKLERTYTKAACT